MTTRPPVVAQFIHIPKTGGAAMNHLLRRVYRDAYYRDHPRFGRDVADLPDHTDVRCISSHRARGYEQTTAFRGKVFAPFALVRHPVDRLVSLYNFATRLETHHWYTYVKDMSPEEFFEALPDRPRSGAPPFEETDWDEFSNKQAKLIAGDQDPTDVIDIVEHEFLAIATTERHGELTQALAKALDWPPQTWEADRRNESDHRLVAAELDDGLRARIEAANTVDLELFEFVARLEQPMVNSIADLVERSAPQ